MQSTDSNPENYSPAPWSYEYNPYTMSEVARGSRSEAETEIPAFEICDVDGNKIFETNENSPQGLQEANARLAVAAPELLDALDYFFNIMHDYECSARKGYVKQALQKARKAISQARGVWA